MWQAAVENIRAVELETRTFPLRTRSVLAVTWEEAGRSAKVWLAVSDVGAWMRGICGVRSSGVGETGIGDIAPQPDGRNGRLVDVMDEGNRLEVIVELPGADEKALSLQVRGNLLDIGPGDPCLCQRISLPVRVRSTGYAARYKNGLLHITLEKL